MTTLGGLEANVLARLREVIPAAELAVEPYPAKPDEYQLLHPKGAVLVFVRESRYSHYSNGAMQCNTRFIVTLLLRNFSAHQSAYGWIESVQQSLFGFTPSGWQPIRLVSEQFIGEESGVWQYDLLFEVDCLTVSQFNLCIL